jgi:AcrR family transcriptional regulator
MSLRDKKKIETRKSIFEIAGRLFKEKGYDNTTVDEITKEAGIGKGTFFNYFPTKEALLQDFIKQKEELVFDLVKDQLTRNIPTKEKIKNILVLVAKSNEKDRELTKLFVFEHLKHYGHEERRSTSLNHLIQVIFEKSAKTEEFKIDIDLKMAAGNIAAIYFYSLMEWLWSKSDYSLSEDISKKIDMMFIGIVR